MEVRVHILCILSQGYQSQVLRHFLYAVFCGGSTSYRTHQGQHFISVVYECFHHKFVVKCKLWVERPPSLSGGIGSLNNQGHRIPVAVSSDAADLYLGRTSSLGYRSKVHTVLIIDSFAISRNGKPQFMYHGFLIPWLGRRLHSSTRRTIWKCVFFPSV